MFILSQQNSIANHFIAEMRDVTVQKDRMRFRKNMERLGEILAYEISKTLPYEAVEIKTPLSTAKTQLLTHQPVLATVLRAGLTLYQGFINYFDHSESAFIGAYRGQHKADHSFEIHMEYAATPNLENKTLILIDPMLATGRSLVLSYQALLQHGIPKHTHIVSAIATSQGVEYLQKHLSNFSLWLGALDERLDENSYIIPGLGDAGDLSFGEKV